MRWRCVCLCEDCGESCAVCEKSGGQDEGIGLPAAALRSRGCCLCRGLRVLLLLPRHQDFALTLPHPDCRSPPLL